MRNEQYTPLVSVIMNCFNGEEFLTEAIESVLDQTYVNWEIIFWDNMSTDNSAQKFKNYKDPRFKYYSAQIHTPLYEARNNAISKAGGELVAFLDVDDIWIEDKLALQVPLFLDEKIGFSCGKYFLINQRKSRNSITNVYMNRDLPAGNIVNELLEDYFIHVSTLMVRKSTLDKISGPCDSRFNIIGDLDLAVNLSLISEFSPVQQPLAYYRWHNTNTGIAKAFSFCDEFDLWFSEKELDPRLNHLSGFLTLNKKNSWSKCIKAIYEGKKIKAIKYANNTTFKNKMKLWLSILMPTFLAKKIIDR